jgi:hypothetical protein
MSELEQMFVSRVPREIMIEAVKSSETHFQEAVKIALSAKEPACWRAAWILEASVRKNDKRLEAYADQLIETIAGKADGYQRELIKLIFKIELSEEQEGRLFDICVSIWESVGKSSSVRCFAFNFISDVVSKYPELVNEVAFLTQSEYLEPLSPGIRRSVEKKVVKMLTNSNHKA